MEIHTVGVVGCGTMGSGICEVCARGGFDVVFAEASPEAVAAGHERISRSVERAVARGKLDRGGADAVLARIRSTTELEGLAGCDVVFEAVPEHLDIKKSVFSRLDGILERDAILATNTSSLPVIDMAVATQRPDRVLGFHFFNPAQVMPLVELVYTVATEQSVIDSARVFAQRLGKTPVPCRDRAGFIANLLLFPYLNSAVRMLDQGFASREDIDAAMQLGAGHPMGPLALLDLIGLDSAYEICEALWRQFRDTQDAPPALLKQYVVAGYLGRKTGRGFYRYEAPESPKTVDAVPDFTGVATSDVRRVGVVGASPLALAIAETVATSGAEVLLHAPGEEPRSGAEGVAATGDVAALAEVDLALEAVAGGSDRVHEVFRELDRSIKPDAILATTTSFEPVVDLAAATDRPDRVVGLHFLHPAARTKVVEVVHTVATSPEVEKRATAWVRSLGRRPVRCRDRAGFVVNFLLFPYLNDAIRMHEQGYSTPADIDTAMKLGCGHPVGPFELMDEIGLDVTLDVLDLLHDEFRERRYAPAPLLEHMVRAGYLGRSTGRGFYDHT